MDTSVTICVYIRFYIVVSRCFLNYEMSMGIIALAWKNSRIE